MSAVYRSSRRLLSTRLNVLPVISQKRASPLCRLETNLKNIPDNLHIELAGVVANTFEKLIDVCGDELYVFLNTIMYHVYNNFEQFLSRGQMASLPPSRVIKVLIFNTIFVKSMHFSDVMVGNILMKDLLFSIKYYNRYWHCYIP